MINACEKFGCLPEELYQTDSELVRLLNIVEQGTPPEDEEMYDPEPDEYYEEV